jgi:hypothetical protein
MSDELDSNLLLRFGHDRRKRILLSMRISCLKTAKIKDWNQWISFLGLNC